MSKLITTSLTKTSFETLHLVPSKRVPLKQFNESIAANSSSIISMDTYSEMSKVFLHLIFNLHNTLYSKFKLILSVSKNMKLCPFPQVTAKFINKTTLGKCCKIYYLFYAHFLTSFLPGSY